MTVGHGGEVRRGILWIATGVIVFLVVGLVYMVFVLQNERMIFLEEQNRLLRESLDAQAEYCEGIERVNQVCENAMVALVVRLGLDPEKLPVFTAGIVSRHNAGRGGP